MGHHRLQPQHYQRRPTILLMLSLILSMMTSIPSLERCLCELTLQGAGCMVGFANVSIHRRRSQKHTHSHSQCIMCWRVLPLLSLHQTHRKRYIARIIIMHAQCAHVSFTQCIYYVIPIVPVCPVVIQHALSLQYNHT